MTTTIIPALRVGCQDAPPPPLAADAMVTNDGWFPDIDPADLRLKYKIRDVVTAARLREAVLGAMIEVSNDLNRWADRHCKAGYATLADVPAPQLGGESRLVILYRRAIGSATKALVVEGYRDTDLTGTGQRQVSDLDPSVGELRRDSLFAIRDMLGKGRVTVELL